MTMTKSPPSTFQHELTKAFLFLRTCIIAITNTEVQIQSTKAYVQWNSVNGNYNEHMAYATELETQQRDLGLWEDRWAEAGVGLISWVVMRSLGRSLPMEILGMVGRELRRGDMELPPLR